MLGRLAQQQLLPGTISSTCSTSYRPAAAPCLHGGLRRALGRCHQRSTGCRRQLHCRAAEQDTSQQAGGDAPPPGESRRIKQTLAGLDALLGIEEEVKDEKKDESPKLNFDVSANVMEQIAAAEASRAVGSAGASKDDVASRSSGSLDEQGLNDQMKNIVEQARKIADGKADDSAGEAALRKEFEGLLQMLKPEDSMDKADLKLIKDKVFGPMSFWVTETVPMGDLEGGLLVRGNLRGEQSAVFEQVCASMKQLFGDKYTVFLVEDPASYENADGSTSGADVPLRPAFQITLTSAALPQPTQGWQAVAAVVLLVLTLGSSLQVGLVANLAKLPKETLDWLANPENVNSEMLPPGLESWDPTPYLQTALPIAMGVFGVAMARELGMRSVAALRGVKLGPAYFVPNGQIGSFFSSTPLKGLVKNRSDLFDVAAAGAASAGAASAALFLAGLAYTHGGELPQDMLVPVPSQLFQGSLLLGGLAKLGLGDVALRSATVMVHPFLIAGWCGLVATALNCLPVGSVDGGRMTQAAFGRGSLGLTGFFTYVGLGLGFLGSSLSLPFGLYVLICARGAEKYVQDNLSMPDDTRRAAAAAAVLLAVLVLLPMAPELADTVGVGPQSPFL